MPGEKIHENTIFGLSPKTPLIKGSSPIQSFRGGERDNMGGRSWARSTGVGFS